MKGIHCPIDEKVPNPFSLHTVELIYLFIYLIIN